MKVLRRIRERLGSGAIDWTLGAERPLPSRPQSIDIIVPVYGAAAALRRCLDSVAAHTDLVSHRLLLVIDGPQPTEVESSIGLMTARPGVVVLRNEARLGFVGSVNRGMAASTSDVILLNSDTIVTSRWVEQLVDAAMSCGDAGTVTPLSNHASLCSVPRSFEENELPSGFDADSFAAVVARVSKRSYPRLPTGVGVCLYIRRALLDDIGSFDAENFGLGYGEENDFCMRALQRGWLHLADDATFIEHAGHQSFGKERAALQRSGWKALRRLHPRYLATIGAFMRRDPLAAVRAGIIQAIAPASVASRSRRKKKIVHLVHGWPPFQQAGTEMYAWWLVRRQRDQHDTAVYTRMADPSREHAEAVEWLDEGVRVRRVNNTFDARNPIVRNAIADRKIERDFARFLDEERPDLLHIHHLAGHAFSLAPLARRRGIPVLMQLQDWWALCARVNLLHRDGNRCSGPAPEKCASCVTLTKLSPSGPANRAMHAFRRKAARSALHAADAYVAGSQAIANDYRREGVLSVAPFHVLPYGIELAARGATRQPVQRPIRFGYLGSIAPHKGVHTAVEAMSAFSHGEASLHLWGDAGGFPEYVAALAKYGAPIHLEGRFAEEEKARVFASMDVLLVPSIGLESFGLAPREAMQSGVPVVATEGGALSEMFEPGVCGEFFPPGDAVALESILRRIVADPSIVDRWSARLPVPKGNEEHAAEIEAVYRTLWKGKAK